MTEHATTLLLVRHGHVEGIEPARFRGRVEVPLTELGHRQAAALRDRIAAEWVPDAISASPMGRCVDTGSVIASAFGLTVEAVAGLTDLHYGAWQWLTEAEVHARWTEEWVRWQHTPHLVKFPEGERLSDLAKRAVNALHIILHAHCGGTVVIVTHDSVNRVLLLHALDLPLSHYRAIAQAPCGLNALSFDSGRFNVRTINETGHLLRLCIGRRCHPNWLRAPVKLTSSTKHLTGL